MTTSIDYTFKEMTAREGTGKKRARFTLFLLLNRSTAIQGKFTLHYTQYG